MKDNLKFLRYNVDKDVDKQRLANIFEEESKMKNETTKTFIDGDMVYAIAVTAFTGACIVGAFISLAIGKLF